MSDEASSGYTSTAQETSESDSEEIPSSNSSSAGTRFYSSDSELEDGEANKARAGKELTLVFLFHFWAQVPKVCAWHQTFS